MSRKSLRRQLYPSYLILALASMIAVGWFSARAYRRFYLRECRKDLEARARLIREQLPKKRLAPEEGGGVQALCARLGERSGTRVTVILPSGEVLADSDEDPARMDNHKERPEIAEALRGTVGEAIRYSDTLQRDMLYVALPLEGPGGEIEAVLRTSLPLSALDEAIAATTRRLILAGAVLAALAAAVCWPMARRIARPIEQIRRGAERFAAGDLEKRLPMQSSEEIAALAETLNDMAAQLDERIRTVALQRNEREAILASMVEGVLAVGSDRRVISVNRTAAHMLGLASAESAGKTVEEVLRNPSLSDLIAKALASETPVEDEISIEDNGERVLRVRGGPMKGADEGRKGAVIVLNDITRLRRLENMRRDFVANVSHELKTPITTIKGFAETLLDGAVDDPARARRFLDIILRQSDRLDAIIRDLLVLSSLENDESRGGIALAPVRLKDVIGHAAETCRPRAEAKRIGFDVSCSERLAVMANGPLLEQALANLLNNAVKYSDPDGAVDIAASEAEGEVLLSVRDRGVGIGREHLPRIFERFYRVDAARSREMGGTGLGLAIVKHIAQVHRGSVTVESAPGEGSAFTLHLQPAPRS